MNARSTVASPPDERQRVAGQSSRAKGRAGGAGAFLLTSAIAIALSWISFDRGSYDIGGRALIAIACWWLLAGALALGLWPVERTPVAARVAAAGLAALAALTGASLIWAESAENVVTELNRVLLYLGIFLAAALGVSRRSVGRLCDGAALGLTAVGILALFTRLFPDVIDTSEALRFLIYGRTRLNYPVGYWNGLSILLALTIPLLLRLAVGARMPVRVLAVSSVPLLGGAMYLTGSRTGVVAAAIATLVFFALTPRRLAASAVILLSGIATAGVLAVLTSRDALVDGPLGSELAEEQGHSATRLILALCVAAGVVYCIGALLARRLPQPGQLAERIALGVAALALVVGVVVSDPLARFDEFQRLPAELENQGVDVQSRFGSTSGNGRWQMWSAAAEQFRAHPLIGDGAGSFQSWWERERSLPLFVRDAHSLYMETLGELGIVGLLLLVIALGAGACAVGRRAGHGNEEQRLVLAALAGTFAGFTLAAAADWMWEFTVVSVVAIAALGLVTGRATTVSPASAAVRLSPALRVPLAFGTALVVIFLALIPLLAEIEVRESQAAARRGDLPAALDSALAARRLEPWATAPYLQIALVHESGGQFAAARTWIIDAIERNQSNWSLWLVKARIETRAGNVRAARRSLARARELNPLSFLGPGDPR